MSHAHPKKFFAFEKTKNIMETTKILKSEVVSNNLVKIQELMYASMQKITDKSMDIGPDFKPNIEKKVSVAFNTPRVIPSGVISGSVGVYRKTALAQAESRV